MIYSNLIDHMKTTKMLVKDHGYSGEYVEGLIPFERDFHMGLIVKDLNNREVARSQIG